MLRLTALLLVLANLAYFAWSQGHLRVLGWGTLEEREPARLKQQVAPEKLRVERMERAAEPPRPAATEPAPAPAPAPVPPPEAPASSEPTPGPRAEASACYQAAGFTPAQAQALRVVMTTLPWAGGRWTLDEAVLPPRWIVYMGRYADAEALARKKAELRQLRIEFRDATGMMPGLALGTYSTEAAAQQALADLAPKGIRTARVLQERGEQRTHTLRLNAITPAQRAEVEGLNTAMAGKKLAPC